MRIQSGSPDEKPSTHRKSRVPRRAVLAGTAALSLPLSIKLASGAQGGTGTKDGPSVLQYEQQFLELYDKIKAGGYFSPEGIPYHSIETLLVEAPDHGHETTSEAYSYLIWLEALYGRITGEWGPFNDAWQVMEDHMIPASDQQPTNSFYDPSSPATYASEYNEPESYPSALDPDVAVGSDPLAQELSSAYGTDDIYGMHWIQDVDNVYGYGDGPTFINTYQRGPQESVFETVPHPSIEDFSYGGENGYLDLFVGDQSYAQQWRYTNAPDADARAIQAAYWANEWATEQGNAGAVADVVEKASMMGDYLRYAMYDKYFKTIGDCTSPDSCAPGSGKDSCHYLLSWYYAWGGALDTNAGWAWRIGSSHCHFGYQNPMAAYALSEGGMTPQGATAGEDWGQSLTRQVEFYRWLQSAEGGIAGGATNSWEGAYGQPPSGTPTFYGMAYDWQPVYHDPPSNNWFGFQAWSMQRMAEYYYVSGDAMAGEILDKWVPWVLSEITTGADYQIPSTLEWSGEPDEWNASNPGDNAGLHVSVANYTQDVGITGSLANTLAYYAAASGNAEAQAAAEGLLEGILTKADDLGVSVPEEKDAYDRLVAEVYIPSGFSGTMPNGDVIEPGATFDSIRSFLRDDPDWGKVEDYLNGGEVPTFNYHRFWAQCDAAVALATYTILFGEGV
ncbi:glycoside hydrolase family 48 protein [Streptomyces sp. B6B3]|uniref:glycoside hydrolase family 48 protein n=1 Tax=Streptomyces sp. B6B3 TaxID=3153570 RepID=UPI00325F8CE6